MESTKFLTASLLAAGLMAVGTSANAALTDGLVAYYDFETDLTNQVGPGDLSIDNGEDIAGWSGGTVTRTDGSSTRNSLLVGNAGNFVDIDNDRVEAPFGTTELGDSFAISAWFYLAPNDANGSSRYYVFEGSNNFDVSFGTTGTNDNFRSYVEGTTADNTILARNTWHHVVHSFESDGTNTTLSVYINGALEATDTDLTADLDIAALHFGQSRAGQERDWDGLIDEIGIWDRALTAQEVLDIRAAGLAGEAIPEPGSLALLGLGGLLIARRRRD